MSFKLEIEDDIVEAIKFPRPELEQELMKELAFALYARQALPMGKARKLTGLTKREFLEALAKRKIPRQYAAEDLQEDVGYATRCK